MQLAMYKGPADDWAHKIGHWVVSLLTRSKYSHCELVIGGVCYSSTSRDIPPGVRAKVIDLTSGKWDLFDIKGDEQKALAWFKAHMGQPYDWRGVFRFAFPFLSQNPGEWFCDEACGAALGEPNPEDNDPQELLNKRLTERTP